MKKEGFSFLGNLFGGKRQPIEGEKSFPVIMTSSSQPHVLRQKMQEEKLSHGETVMANLSPVRLESAYGKMVLYFCPLKNIEVLTKLSDGDGGCIPAQAKLEGLIAPDTKKPGFYTLKNVELTSNGSMMVKATDATIWEIA